MLRYTSLLALELATASGVVSIYRRDSTLSIRVPSYALVTESEREPFLPFPHLRPVPISLSSSFIL